jgi:hypothetical protein
VPVAAVHLLVAPALSSEAVADRICAEEVDPTRE